MPQMVGVEPPTIWGTLGSRRRLGIGHMLPDIMVRRVSVSPEVLFPGLRGAGSTSRPRRDRSHLYEVRGEYGRWLPGRTYW